MNVIVPTTHQDRRIARLTAVATTIHIAESALSSPLPGVKPGLANVAAIVALIQYGWAAGVAALRVLFDAQFHPLPALLTAAVKFAVASGMITHQALQRLNSPAVTVP
jgi:uncharacterized membrane protein